MERATAVISEAQLDDLDAMREMLREYAEWLRIDLTFQQFAREVEQLPGDYQAPDGALLIARIDGSQQEWWRFGASTICGAK